VRTPAADPSPEFDLSVLDEEPAPRPAKPPKRRLLAATGSTVWIAMAILCGFNAMALVVTVQGGRRAHDGIEALRDELAIAVHAARTNATSLPAGDDHVAAPADLPVQERATTPPVLEPVRPLVPAEDTALAVAAREIESREFASARRRLWRLLAVLDRIEPERRADVEARASFMLAQSWQQQARIAREAAP
jgi:hypothetical protein